MSDDHPDLDVLSNFDTVCAELRAHTGAEACSPRLRGGAVALTA